MRTSTVVLAAMVVSVTLLHAHAWSASREDNCEGLGNPEWRPVCGDSYADEFPVRYFSAAALVMIGAATLSLRRTRGQRAVQRWARALALAGLAYLAFRPLSFTLRDWHSESAGISTIFLVLISFPVNVPLLAVGVYVFSNARPLVAFPYLGGDAVYGSFSTALGAWFVTLGACAYAQWFVLLPWLSGRCRTWWQRRRRVGIPTDTSA